MLSYEEFKETLKTTKYAGEECFVGWCHNPAEYEVGDVRFYCGYCEECADIKGQYDAYVKKELHKEKIRKIREKFCHE